MKRTVIRLGSDEGPIVGDDHAEGLTRKLPFARRLGFLECRSLRSRQGKSIV